MYHQIRKGNVMVDEMTIKEATTEYFILALDRSTGQDLLVWWKPNDTGYTIFLEEAGRYTHRQVTEKADYYNNGEALAIPVHEVKAHAKMAVYRDEWGADMLNKAQAMVDAAQVPRSA